MTSSTLAALAEDPEFYIEPPDGSQRIADERFCLVVGPHRRWAGVCRLRLPSSPDAVTRAVAEVRSHVAGIEQVVWNVGSSATPEGLPDLLRALGLGDPEPPMDPLCAGMTLTDAPPPVEGVEVRRITSLAEHRAGLEIMLAAATWNEAAADAERARAEEVFQRRTRRGGHQWLAFIDGTPAAFALADPAGNGLYLAGGSTLPEARGRGCYRALVRARWDEAVRLGLPGLAVQAQHGTSVPILRRMGFAEVATIHTLQ